jgi:hypothetical protein
MGNENRDGWSKAEIILRPIGGLLAALSIAALGFFGSRYMERQKGIEANVRLYSELMSKREEAESALRKDMFTSIIGSFLKPESASLEAKVLNLELLACNFHESLNLKPLFMHLRKRITHDDTTDTAKREYLERLDKVAKQVTRKQMLILIGAGKKFDRHIDFDSLLVSFEITEQSLEGLKSEASAEFDSLILKHAKTDLRVVPDYVLEKLRNIKNRTFTGFPGFEEAILDEKIGKEATVTFKSVILKHASTRGNLGSYLLEEESLELDEIKRDFRISVLKADSAAKELKVKLEILRTPKLFADDEEVDTDDEEEAPREAKFWLGFFDFPMIDNTRLSGDQRCAIVLNDFERNEVGEWGIDITVIYFPGAYASLKEKPYFHDVVQKLVKTKYLFDGSKR